MKRGHRTYTVTGTTPLVGGGDAISTRTMKNKRLAIRQARKFLREGARVASVKEHWTRPDGVETKPVYIFQAHRKEKQRRVVVEEL